MMELLPNVLRAIISTTANVLLMMSLLQPKYSKRVTRLAMLGVLAADLGTAIYCYLEGNLTMLARIDTVLFLVLCFAVRPLFKDTFMQWLFSYLTLQNISDMVIILSFAGSRHLPYSAYANSVLRIILFGGFLFILLRYVRPLYRQAVEHWPAYFAVALGLYLTFSYYTLTADDIVVMLTEQAVPLLLVIFIGLAAYGSILFSLKNISAEYALREEKLRADARQAVLESELAAVEASLSAAKRSRHDLHHHNAVVLEYLKSSDTEHAIRYLETMDAELAATSFKQFCKNSTANAVLRVYDRKAQTAEIPFAVQADIPSEMPLEGPEIGALLSNILENAVEACMKLKPIHGHISLTAQTGETGWRLEVRNRMDGTVKFENGLPHTTKVTGGTGTKSIAKIVESHGGLFRFQQEGNFFITQIILPISN